MDRLEYLARCEYCDAILSNVSRNGLTGYCEFHGKVETSYDIDSEDEMDYLADLQEEDYDYCE